MLNAIASREASTPHQRCVAYKIENVLSSVPTKQLEPFHAELTALFYQGNRQEADQAVAAFIAKYQAIESSAV